MTLEKKSAFGIMAVLTGLIAMSIPSANAVLYNFYSDEPLKVTDVGEHFAVMYIVNLEAYANNSAFEAEPLNDYVDDSFIP